MSQHISERLTMTALRDLDPAGPAAALSEDERARADATFSRIVSAPDHPPLGVEPERPRGARLPRRILVAAGLACATGVATSALLHGGTAYGSWTPTPKPLEGKAATTAAASCRAALDVPDQGEQLLVAEQRGDWTYVLIGGSHTEAACLLPNDIVGHQDPADYEGKFFGQYDADAPPAPRVAPDRILETMNMSGSTDEGGLFNWSQGYVGRNVVGVTLHTPTGLEVEASVTRGRFAAWWPAGEAKADNPEFADAPTFTVTLADGSTRETPG
jgi:hypothetical protein